MRKYSGFTLIELMIVVAIIAVLVAIAVPNLLRYRATANETNAAAGLRVISTGEIGFQCAAVIDTNGDGTGDYGTLAQMANPPGGGDPPPFIDSVLGSGVKHGYVYVVNVVLGTAAVQTSYTCTASPAGAGRTGVRRFFVDDSGVIRFTSDGSVPDPTSPPLN